MILLVRRWWWLLPAYLVIEYVVAPALLAVLVPLVWGELVPRLVAAWP